LFLGCFSTEKEGEKQQPTHCNKNTLMNNSPSNMGCHDKTKMLSSPNYRDAIKSMLESIDMCASASAGLKSIIDNNTFDRTSKREIAIDIFGEKIGVGGQQRKTNHEEINYNINSETFEISYQKGEKTVVKTVFTEKEAFAILDATKEEKKKTYAITKDSDYYDTSLNVSAMPMPAPDVNLKDIYTHRMEKISIN
jgi:hypothetical protein